MKDFALEVFFSAWEFKARYLLSASDAESLSIADLLAMASDADREAFEHLRLGYIETEGTPALRAAVAETYDAMTPENILCFAGAEEAIYASMRVMLGPEDHAVVVTPNYQSAETVPLAQCAVTGVALDAADGWSLDIDAVEAALRPNTALVSINFPNNPTGKVLERERFDALVALCRRRGIWLFSDEVYRLIERDPSRRLPQVADVYERGLSLNVMSKAYGLAGLRVGWIAAQDRGLLARLERYKHYLSICNGAPSELLATIALKNRARILARNRALVARNLDLLSAFFAAFPGLFQWSVPEGGCIGFPRYLGADGVEHFTDRLLADTGILLLPASNFASDLTPVPMDRFRVGFGRAGIVEALDAWRDWLRR